MTIGIGRRSLLWSLPRIAQLWGLQLQARLPRLLLLTLGLRPLSPGISGGVKLKRLDRKRLEIQFLRLNLANFQSPHLRRSSLPFLHLNLLNLNRSGLNRVNLQLPHLK
ncbi:MAG: hypothetical protein ACO4AI_00625, partial [Prochlorothrix sp.]